MNKTKQHCALCLTLMVVMACSTCRAFSQSAPIAPIHPITTEQVQKIMTITHSLDRMKTGIHQMVDQQKSSAPYLPDAFWKDFEVEFMKLDWVAIATPIYQKYLSQEDAEKAIAFYNTDAGQHALDSATAVIDEMTKAGFEQGKTIGVRLGEKYKDQIEQNMKNMAPPAAPGSK